jgi:invasion protein IalB
VAEYPIAEPEIASLMKGADLSLSVQTVDKTPFTFKLSAAGFSAAYAKMTSK